MTLHRLATLRRSLVRLCALAAFIVVPVAGTNGCLLLEQSCPSAPVQSSSCQDNAIVVTSTQPTITYSADDDLPDENGCPAAILRSASMTRSSAWSVFCPARGTPTATTAHSCALPARWSPARSVFPRRRSATGARVRARRACSAPSRRTISTRTRTLETRGLPGRASSPAPRWFSAPVSLRREPRAPLE